MDILTASGIVLRWIDIPGLANIAIGNRNQANSEMVQGLVSSIQSSEGCPDREFS